MDRRALEDYVDKVSLLGSLTSYDHVRVEKISKLGGGISNDVYSFLLVNAKEGGEKYRFVLRMYNDDSDKARKEYEILRALEDAGFPVPHVYLYEKDCKILGKSFIIMDDVQGRPMGKYIEKLDKKEKRKRTWEITELFAETLAELHRLKWEYFNLTWLHPPKDEYDYAERQGAILKSIIDYLQHELHTKIKKDYTHPITWLQNNAKLNSCDRYSIVHGDYNPDNVIVTDDKRIIVIDWEGVEIGDPVADVGYAYHFIRLIPGAGKASEGEALAEHFVSHYTKNLGETIDDRLEFYKVAAALKLAIFLNIFIHPQMILKNFGLKWIMLYPLVHMFLRNWKSYMENFVEEHTG